MKLIKYIFLLLLSVVIGSVVYVAISDGKFYIEESKIIDAPDELLFSIINEYRTWEKWGPWMDQTDDMIISYTNTTSGKGASYSWKSKSKGDGSMLTEEASPFSSISQKITFITPFGESNSDVFWKLEKIEEKKTKVTWGMKGTQSFFEKAYWITQDSTLSQNIKPMYHKGLSNLDTYVQEKMKIHTLSIDGVTEHKGGFYMHNATTSSIEDIPKKMNQMIPAVKAYMSQNNLPQTGTPFTIYNEINKEQGTAIFSIAIPTSDLIVTPPKSSILCSALPKQKVVKATLTGDYKYLPEAWIKSYKYISENNLEIETSSPVFEIYKINPDIQPNPAKWITELFIPIK